MTYEIFYDTRNKQNRLTNICKPVFIISVMNKKISPDFLLLLFCDGVVFLPLQECRVLLLRVLDR